MIISSFLNYAIKLTCKKVSGEERKHSVVRYSSFEYTQPQNRVWKISHYAPNQKIYLFPLLDYQTLGSPQFILEWLYVISVIERNFTDNSSTVFSQQYSITIICKIYILITRLHSTAPYYNQNSTVFKKAAILLFS